MSLAFEPRRAAPRVGLLALLALHSWACTPSASCTTPVVGTPGSGAELWPAALVGELLFPLSDGDTVPQTRPLQGGHVLFVGAFLRNVRGCGALRGELRRLDQGGGTGPIVVFDERSTDLRLVQAGEKTPPGGGWGRTEISVNAVANIPTCPNVQPMDLIDQPMVLQVSYTEPGGSQPVASATRKVVPRCSQTDPRAREQCRCECLANYTIDRCLAPADAGGRD